jgi:hypothetical protein
MRTTHATHYALAHGEPADARADLVHRAGPAGGNIFGPSPTLSKYSQITGLS